MMKNLKRLSLLNIHDLSFALTSAALPFALIHLITALVMVIVRPDESIMIAGMLFPFTVGLAAMSLTSNSLQVHFLYAVKFGSTRKAALTLTLSHAAILTVCTAALCGALAAFERTCAMPIWRFLSGNPQLSVDDFGFVWWSIPLGAVIGYLVGLIYGALLLKFAGKALWMFMLAWVGVLTMFQNLPWKTHEVTNVLIPAAAAAGIAASVWAVCTIRKIDIKN